MVYPLIRKNRLAGIIAGQIKLTGAPDSALEGLLLARRLDVSLAEPQPIHALFSRSASKTVPLVQTAKGNALRPLCFGFFGPPFPSPFRLHLTPFIFPFALSSGYHSSMNIEAPILLVYLDAYHLGDPLFLRGFAGDVKAHVGPLILVHGSGEEAERALEARGLLTEEEKNGPAAQQLIERAIRDLNRRIVHELNDAGVPAVGVFGVDRGLLRRSGRRDVEAGTVDWLVALARQGGIPVVGGLVGTSADEFTEADPAQVLVALALAVEAATGVVATVVAFTTNRKAGLFDGAKHLPTLSVNDLSSFPSVTEVEVLRRVAASVRVRLTTPHALAGESPPGGTVLEAQDG